MKKSTSAVGVLPGFVKGVTSCFYTFMANVSAVIKKKMRSV